MNKFDGNWVEDKVKDLLIAHKGRSHTETALNLSEKWGVLVTRDAVKNKFNSLNSNKLSEKVINSDPNKSREYYDKSASDEGKSNKRVYFITSAIAGCALDEHFYKSIRQFCKHREAKLVVFPMRGITSKDEEYNEDVLKELESSFFTDYVFNSNVEGFDIGMSPTQMNPLTGLERIAERSSVIVASPKQNMDTIPVGNVGVPHIIQSTGSITRPLYVQNRIGLLASNDHIVGGIVLEVEDDYIFHIRQVQADKDGSFYDLNNKYTLSEVKENISAEAFVMGDIHCGNEDPSAMKAWKEILDEVKPKHVLFHDLFDSQSISHHLENNITAKANRENIFALLNSELDNVCKFLHELTSKYKDTTFSVVASNHDEHLNRYLDEGRFIRDHHNYRLALQLALYRCDGLNPIEEYLNHRFGAIKNLKWLRRDEDFKIAGVQLAVHGDHGPNGARGSLGGLEKSYHNSITGHAHSPKILRDAWQVGTSTKFDMNYNVGPSSWLHASCLLYNNGQRQMIISVDGSWRIKNTKKKVKKIEMA